MQSDMLKYGVIVAISWIIMLLVVQNMAAPLQTTELPLGKSNDTMTYTVKYSKDTKKSGKDIEKEKNEESFDKPQAYMDWGMVADSPQIQATTPDTKEDRKKNRKKKKNKKKDKTEDTEEGDAGYDEDIEECSERTFDELKDMLGPAFNGRYMSVDKPTQETDIVVDQPEDVMADGTEFPGKKTLPFHVDPDYKRELPPDFFLDISWYQEVIQSLPDAAARFLRRIRSIGGGSEPTTEKENSLPWQCDSEIIWTDLGSNYYPRFLRNVRCTRDNCWFGHFKCRPKAFTVTVLKRVRDSCKDGVYDQDWVFEERAVTFCCECVEH